MKAKRHTVNTALITGSYGGFGTCLAQIHAENGGDLILVGRNQTKLDAQKKQLMDQYHIKAETIAVDLSNADAALEIYEICKENNWEIDILINNAGFGGRGEQNNHDEGVYSLDRKEYIGF